MPWKLGIPALTLALVLACAPGGADSALDADSDAEPSPDTDDAPFDTDAAGDTSSEIPPFIPSYWAIGGSWILTAGEVDLATSVSMLDGSGDGTNCRVEAALDRVSPLELPQEPAGMLTWWKVELTPMFGGACGWGGPTEVELGFGPPDLAVQPAADRAGLSVLTSFGLYARAPSGTIVVVGVAGTAEQLAGATDPTDTGLDTAAPDLSVVVDGTYMLHTLYLLPVDP